MPKDIKKLLLKADKLQMGKEMALAEEFIDIGEKMDENKDIIEKKLDTTIQGLNDLREIKNVIENKDTEVIRTELLHVVTLKGDKGDDYILTNKDKKEIASMVKVPVVEKVVEKVTEVVNQPIESIIEKAVYESGIDIVNKINLLPIDEDSQIDASHIKNLPETVRSVGFGSMIKEAPKDDKYYVRQNRQWVESPAGGSGGTWGSITGTLSDQTDLQNALNAKQNTITTGTTAQYFRGDLSLATFPTNVSTFTNDSGYITSSALTGYVPTTRTLTINGTTLDLSADRSWTIAVPTKTSDLTNDSGFITSSALTGYIQNNVGISGGTTLIGDTTSGGNLTLSSTSHATKGKILFGTSAYDEVNNRLGIGTNSPTYTIDTGTTARAKIGCMILGAWSVNTNYAFFGSSGFDQTVAGNYGLIQGSDGTYVNTPSSTNLGFRRNNSNILYFPSTGGAQLITTLGISTTTSVNTTRELSLTQANANPAMAFIRWDLTTVDTDVLGKILFNAELSASGSGTERTGASIEAQASETWTSTSTASRLVFNTTPTGSTTPTAKMTITSTGNVGIGATTPTARLHLPAGTATASTAPIKLTSGTLLTTAEAGAMEYNNTPHFTNSDATRRHIVTAPNTTKVTASAPYTNDGYITINIGGTDFKVMTTA